MYQQSSIKYQLLLIGGLTDNEEMKKSENISSLYGIDVKKLLTNSSVRKLGSTDSSRI